jgi:tagatose-1,6-bisphosphate aldolase non-catalytic subunit AgaZ/GatZ
VTQSTTNTVQDQKESFKYSIGVSVSTPVGVSTGMKHTEEHGSDQQDAAKETSSHDRDIFEACGGDTILANNPVSWAPTVAKYQNWRVINVSLVFLEPWHF